MRCHRVCAVHFKEYDDEMFGAVLAVYVSHARVLIHFQMQRLIFRLRIQHCVLTYVLEVRTPRKVSSRDTSTSR